MAVFVPPRGGYGVEGPYGFGGTNAPASYRQPDGSMQPFTPEHGWYGPGGSGPPGSRNPPVRTPVPNYQPPAENYQKTPQQPPGGGAGGWGWINGQWGHNLPAGGVGLPQPGQQQPAQGGAGSVANITTPYKPQSIYSPEQTQIGVNNAVAANTPDAYEALKAAGNRHGISHGAADAAQANAIMNGQRLAGNEAAAQIPLLDFIANQKNLMAGEQASSQFGFDAANLLTRLQAARDKQYFGNQGNQLSLLGQLMGGV